MNTKNAKVHNLNHEHQYYAKELTKNAALACYDWIGKGKEKAADAAAVEAMRNTFNKIDIDGRIVIGEGERDKAPMLYIGEKVGCGKFAIDIAVDPLEGTTICAKAMPNSISTIALAARDQLLNAPDTYMDKIAIGKGLPKNIVNLDDSLKNNLINLARAKKCNLSDLKVCILDRLRHEELIRKCHELNIQVSLTGDGDVSAAIATCFKHHDIYIGIGGAPEGVLAAAALKCLGGQMQGRLIFDDESQKTRAKDIGILDLNKIYSINDMVKSDVIFCATGVTTGWLLNGVKISKQRIKTSHIIMHYSLDQILRISEENLAQCVY